MSWPYGDDRERDGAQQSCVQSTPRLQDDSRKDKYLARARVRALCQRKERRQLDKRTSFLRGQIIGEITHSWRPKEPSAGRCV